MKIEENMLADREIIFQTSGSPVSADTYQEGGRKYLLCRLGGTNFNTKLRDCLVCPDDNSDLANHIRTNPYLNTWFSTPFSNLEFRKNFLKWGKGKRNLPGLFIKNTDQVKSSEYKFPAQPITLKVISQKKKIIKDPNGKETGYFHELEVEPFSLEIEGLPKIKRIEFSFAGIYGSLQTERGKLLTETKLYNSKLLDESAGKTFTMGVKEWQLDYKTDDDNLTFYTDRDFDLDSFKEVIEIPKQDDWSNNQEPDNKDKKRDSSELEAEIQRLKKQKTEGTPEQQAENQRKIAEKEKELEKIKKENKLRDLEKRLNSNTQKQNSDNNFPTGLVVGGAILTLIGLVAVMVYYKRRKKRSSY